jgi:hypothetical protein
MTTNVLNKTVTASNDPNLDVMNNNLLLASDNNNICLVWSDALTNKSMSSIFDNLSDNEKKLIKQDGNYNSRKCLSINNINQCFTPNGVLETCNKLESSNRNELRQGMTRINNEIDVNKNKEHAEFDSLIAKKTDEVNTLIKSYSSRQDMLNMNNGYHKMLDKNINQKTKEENELGDNLNKIDDLKNFIVEDIKDVRKKQFWYQTTNSTLTKSLWILLIILLSVLIINMLGLTTIWSKQFKLRN